MRISVQLIEAATDRSLWTKSFDRDLRDVLALHNEVAGAIATEVSAALTPRERRRLATARPVNPRAYELLVKSRVLDDREAIDYLKQATALDPGYADAHAALASVYYYAAVSGPLFSPREGVPLAKAEVVKVLELDPEHSDAHAVLGDILFRYDWDYAGAERELRRAVQLNPNGSRANSSLAYFLTPPGRVDEALDAARRTLEVDPFEGDYALGWVYLRGRRFEEAIEPLAKAARFMPTARTWSLANLAMAQWLAQRRPEALATCDRIPRDKFVVTSGAFCAYVYGAGGREPDARWLIDGMKRSAAGGYLEPTLTAIGHIGLGERDEALAWLEKAYSQRSMVLVGIRQLPWFDPVRSDARFQDVVRRLKFPEN